MKFAVNWFHNVNLALYSNRIMPDRCLVHRCSNRSDMNAGISAHFSPAIKSERDTWLRFVHTYRANLNPSGIKFVAGVFSPFRRGVFFKSVSHGRLSSLAYSWLNSYNTGDRARETIFQTTTPQGKPWSILFSSILYVYYQTSLRIVNIFSSNSLSLVLFISPRCCISVYFPSVYSSHAARSEDAGLPRAQKRMGGETPARLLSDV